MTTFDPVLKDETSDATQAEWEASELDCGDERKPRLQPSDGTPRGHNLRLLRFLKKEPSHSITPLESWERLGIYRLGARVWDLKQAGIVIRSELVEVRNQFGETCRVARYTLEAT